MLVFGIGSIVRFVRIGMKALRILVDPMIDVAIKYVLQYNSRG